MGPTPEETKRIYEEGKIRLKGCLTLIAIFFLICYIGGCNSKNEQQYSTSQTPPSQKTNQQIPSQPIEKSEVTRKVSKKYPDDNPQEIIYYENGKEIAKEIFDDKGNIKKFGKIPDGIIKQYYENGDLRSEYTYKNNKREGTVRIYYENGKLKEIYNFKNDKAEGTSELYYESGGLKERGNFRNGKKEDINKAYYESGKLQAEYNYKGGELNGVSKTYRESGGLEEEGNYKDGKLEGVSKFYYEGGGLQGEKNYQNNKLEGISKLYYENGNIQVELNFKDGKQEGVAKNYYESGKLQGEMNCQNDNLDGMSKFYYENGKLNATINFKNDKQEGITQKYYESGNLKFESNYKAGKRDGVGKVYHENGKLQGEMNFKDGRLEGLIKLYAEDGTLMEAFNWKDGNLQPVFPEQIPTKEIKKFQKIIALISENDGTPKPGSSEEHQKTTALIPTVASSDVIKKEVREYRESSSSDAPIYNILYCGYYSDGKEIARETISKGGNREIVGKIPDGIVKEYYDSGKLKAEWNYKNNNLDGMSKKYEENGELQGEYRYKEGKIKSISIESIPTQQFSKNIGSYSPVTVGSENKPYTTNSSFTGSSYISETFSGFGQQATKQFQMEEGLVVFKMRHNGDGHFGIWLMDDKGDRHNLLVSHTGNFDGSKAVGIKQKSMYLLDVSANGQWRVAAERPRGTSGHRFFDGKGQQATGLFHLNPGLTTFEMQHDGEGHFGVWLMDSMGDNKELLVTTIGKFNGSKAVGVEEGTYIIDVSADGTWSIRIRN